MTSRVPSVTFRYSHTIGRIEFTGSGFDNPVAMALGNEDRIYVVNRSSEDRNAQRVTICTVGEDYIGEFARGPARGAASKAPPLDGSLVWPTSIALDSECNVYVADEWLNRIAIFTRDGEWIGAWGIHGNRDGQIYQPSGIAFDPQYDLYVVDSGNNRIQKFTKDGKFLTKWGRQGSGDGEFNLPWGIDIDQQANVYVADWHNDRIQKFSPDGRFLMKFGSSGKADGEFHCPTDIAVDNDGIIYVADWGNDRLQAFDSDGTFIARMTGDATISRWAKQKLDSNPDMWQQRDVAHGMEMEKPFWGPVAVEVDGQGHIYVADSMRQRIQVYRKLAPIFLGLYDNARL